MQDMYQYIEKVTDKETFLRFMKMLIDDFRKNPQEWEQGSIDGYLDAMMTWIDDFSKCPNNDVNWESIDYSIIARILYMGKIYE